MRDGLNVYRFLGLSGAIWSVGLGYYLAQRGKSIDLNNWVSKKNSTENVFSTKQPSYKEVLEDQFTGKKNKLYKLKLDGFLTEDEYNDKINLLDTQERVDNEHKKALNRAEEMNKRAKPILDKFDSLLKDGVFTQNEYDQKKKELYEKLSIEFDKFNNLKVGDSYGGGIIFFIDKTRTHGTIVSKHEITESRFLDWKDAQTKCDKFIVKEEGIAYDGWRLPTKEEVTQLYNKKDDVGVFWGGEEYFWTSSIIVSSTYGDSSWGFNFNTVNQLRVLNKLYNGRVLPVRSF